MDPRVAALMAKLEHTEEKKSEKPPEEEPPFKPPSNLEEFIKVEKLVSIIQEKFIKVEKLVNKYRKSW